MPIREDLKSLCHPLLCHPQKPYATPGGGIKKRGGGIKKKTNAPHPKIWKLANLGGVGVVGVVVRGGFYNDLEIGFEGYPRKAL